MAQDRFGGESVTIGIARAEIGEPGGREGHTSGLCACGCGVELPSAGRGAVRRFLSDACRKREQRRIEVERQGKRMFMRQTIDLGKLSIPERQAELMTAAYMVGLR